MARPFERPPRVVNVADLTVAELHTAHSCSQRNHADISGEIGSTLTSFAECRWTHYPVLFDIWGRLVELTKKATASELTMTDLQLEIARRSDSPVNYLTGLPRVVDLRKRRLEMYPPKLAPVLVTLFERKQCMIPRIEAETAHWQACHTEEEAATQAWVVQNVTTEHDTLAQMLDSAAALVAKIMQELSHY